MATTYTAADLDRVSWHDCHVHGLELRTGDPDRGDWTSDLALDLDFILEWPAPASPARFLVAPATLVFHGVTALRIAIDWGDDLHRVALHPLSIGGIERQPVADQRVYLDRPYYDWTVSLNWPAGKVSFGAHGFTQELRAEPVETEAQHLSPAQRRPT
ncbi:MAG: hypothetical protein ACRD0D_12385 [Acidimicrobiales bacterium]